MKAYCKRCFGYFAAVNDKNTCSACQVKIDKNKKRGSKSKKRASIAAQKRTITMRKKGLLQ